MMDRLQSWYRARSPREQRLLALAAGLSLLLLGVFGLLGPGYHAIGQAEKHLEEATKRRGTIEAMVARTKGSTARPAQAIAPAARAMALDAAVAESALANGFELADATPLGGDEFSFRLASTKAGAVFAWLASLEAQGIEINQIRLQKREAGFVSADVRVRRVS